MSPKATTDVEIGVGDDRTTPPEEASNKKMSFFANNGGGKDLVWGNMNMKLMDPKKKNAVKLDILKDVWGKAKAGKTTAIMGASGAGKTSLFQMLTGRVSSGSGTIVSESEIYLGGVRIDPNDREQRKLFAFVAQEDSLHAASTARESLIFSANLRLPRLPNSTRDAEITTIVNQIIDELGLTDCADTVIGGGLMKGLSGGEKRRVSIGLELVASPSILFLDEPTSGLDSFAATQVMNLLDRVAKAGTTVLFTIHQPSSNIFTRFDHLILLNKGRVMYEGDVPNVPADFADCNHPVPTNYNPADWVIDTAQMNTIETLEKSGFFIKQSTDWLKAGNSGDKLTLPLRNKVTFWQELHLLQQREMRTLQRNPTPMLINVGMTALLSVIFGVIFFDVGRADRSSYAVVQSQLGAIVNILISTLMGQSNTAIFVFSSERPLFLREYSTDHYSIVPYFLSKLCSEAINTFSAVLVQAVIVFWLIGFQMGFGHFLGITYSMALTATAVAVLLGAFFTDPQNATALFTLVVVPQFYFSGLFISLSLIPKGVAWAQYLCSLTFGARISLAYEFGECGAGEEGANCQEILDSNFVSVDDLWWYWLAMMGLFCFFRLAGVYVLRAKARY